MKKDWIDKLRDKLHTYEEQPPQGLWEEIEKNLPPVSPLQNSRPIVPKWGKALIATAAALLIGSPLIQFLSSKSKVIIEPEHKMISQLDSLEVEINIPEELENVFAQKISIPKIVRKNTLPSTVLSSVETINSQSQPQESTEAKEIIEQPDNSARTTVQNDSSNVKDKRIYPQDAPFETLHPKQTSIDNPKKVSISLFAGNMSGQRGTEKSYGRNLIQLAADTPLAVGSSKKTPIENEIDFYNQYNETKEVTIHNLPISFGITTSYPLTNRLFVESGLVYTFLSSKTRDGSDMHFSETSRIQHLLGLPLLLKYNFWSNHKLDLYVSGGGTLQWSILSSSQESYYIDKQLTSRINHPNDPRYLIGSIKGAVGIRYQILPNLGIFAEPGINYHFKRDDMPKSIYTDAPLNFNLNLGVNFQFK